MDSIAEAHRPQEKINQLVDCSFEIGRDLKSLSKVFAKAGMKERAAHLIRLSDKILCSASLASVELVRARQ